MKKFLIVMLVLVMASAASAATVKLTVGGSSTVAVALGTTHTVDMSVDLGAKGCANIDFLADSGLLISAVGSWIPALSAASDNGTLTSGDIIDAYGNSAGGVPDQLPNTILYSFDVTVNAYGDVTPFMGPTDAFYTDVSPGYFQVSAQSPVSFVPEPMTIALLGLGGLFLRRRK